MNGAANWDLLLVLGTFSAFMCETGWYVHTHRAPEPDHHDQVASRRYSVENGRENDGRYWATVPALLSVSVHGQSKEKVRARVSALALHTLADRLDSHDIKAHTFCLRVDG